MPERSKGKKIIYFLIVILLFVFVPALVGTIVFQIQNIKIINLNNKYQNSQKEITRLKKTINFPHSFQTQYNNNANKNSDKYKEFKLLSLTSVVPKNWSVLKIPEMVDKSKLTSMPTGAIGTDDITYGDINWEQVNFYFASEDIIDKLIKDAKNDKYNSDSTWTTKVIDGIKAQVNTYPLDKNGKVSKGSTGGQTYYIKLPSGSKSLVIWKQAKGREEFEKGFLNFINNIKFKK